MNSHIDDPLIRSYCIYVTHSFVFIPCFNPVSPFFFFLTLKRFLPFIENIYSISYSAVGETNFNQQKNSRSHLPVLLSVIFRMESFSLKLSSIIFEENLKENPWSHTCFTSFFFFCHFIVPFLSMVFLEILHFVLGKLFLEWFTESISM